MVVNAGGWLVEKQNRHVHAEGGGAHQSLFLAARQRQRVPVRQLVQAELRRSGYEDLIPAGIVLTGGTSKMEGAVELAEEIFHMPVRLGVPYSVKGLTDVVRNPIYSTGVGLLMYGLQKQSDGMSMSVSGSSYSSDEPKAPVLERLKRWVQGNF